MSLDATNLYILKVSGTEKEKKYAAKIEPIRKNGHLLLVTLLLVNTIVNETLPILFGWDLPYLIIYRYWLAIYIDALEFKGFSAVACSTILILIFGEILPQAICSRYGLQIGAFFAFPVQILIYSLSIVVG
jgi:metal transporter CNNM